MNGLRVRELSERDIPFAMTLKNIAGWNQTDRDWQDYLFYDREGCFLAEYDGKEAATMTTIRYGDRFGWIGMVLVHPDDRGRGIATQLLQLGIRHLRDQGVRCIKLDATAMGKKVYVPLGFAEEYDVRRYELEASPSKRESKGATASEYRGEVRSLTEADLEEIAVYDAAIFGADRRTVLKRLRAREHIYAFVTRDDRGITGYLMAHQGYEAVQIGPWAASDVQAAETLLASLLSSVGGGKVFFDLPCPNVHGIQMAEIAGFRIQRTFCRMYLGVNANPGMPQLVYGTSGAEKG
ncbi:Acetyltransferase (GNAT) domain-containing protein [Cohnella sp. OV330]|uniref:GNAT family N-acetyltransferase n=1 Tax=Cohnella sp. OV330 TaxID=1855288 RepID=UPI0008ED4C0F|nr:GNAT family N-acetyltransferase [Cohnella sp. OV330]SFB22169.1 Acetyltransferase (GNAT) domain-containing protein [Cohnella sp. OV330]